MDISTKDSNLFQVALLLERKYYAKTRLNKFWETSSAAASDSVKSAKKP